MDNSSLVSNPFALMMNPAEVVQAMERSERLGRLQRRICKPLDKPAIARDANAAPSIDLDLDRDDAES